MRRDWNGEQLYRLMARLAREDPGRNGLVSMSYTGLGALSDVPRASLVRALRRLESAGLIERVRQRRRAERGSANRQPTSYRVKMDRPVPLDPGPRLPDESRWIPDHLLSL